MLLLHFLPLLFASCASSTTSNSTHSLLAIKSRVEFYDTISDLSAIYHRNVSDGKVSHSIYIVTSVGEDVYGYNVTEDSLSFAGRLTPPVYGSSLIVDRRGDIIRFGGRGTSNMSSLKPFGSGVGQEDFLGRCPSDLTNIGTFKTSNDSALVFAGSYRSNYIFRANLYPPYRIAQLGRISGDAKFTAWDGGDRVFIFGSGSDHQIYSILNRTFTNFTSPEDYSFQSGVVTTPGAAFIPGTLGGKNGLFEFNFASSAFTFGPIKREGEEDDITLSNPATVYVPDLHRMYIFGGFSNCGVDIWYVDLPKSVINKSG